MSSVLKHDYLDDSKLAQRALLEFRRAHATGRMIAFVGSMATEACGYGDWKSLLDGFAASARSQADAAGLERERELINLFKGPFAAATRMSDTVSMSLIQEVLSSEHVRQRPVAAGGASGIRLDWELDVHHSPLDANAVAFAQRFRQPGEARGAESAFAPFDAIGALIDSLGIRRFATLNYDFEIERRLMLPAAGHWSSDGRTMTSAFDALRRMRDDSQRRNDPTFSWDLGSGRIRHVLTQGNAVESDLLNRERIDRLIEFALGTDDVEAHVMHLHGRACRPRSMIVTQRDYDALYRRNDLNRLPFEFARRLLMGGNPILFVGLGMSEHDVNRELAEFVSNNPYHRLAPTFLLWNAGPATLLKEERQLKRLDWLHRLGVLTIFDSDQGLAPETVEDAAFRYRELKKRDAGKGSRRKPPATTGKSEELKALVMGVRELGKAAAEKPREACWTKAWRSMDRKVGTRFEANRRRPLGDRTPTIFWETLSKPVTVWSDADRARVLGQDPMVCVVGSSGCGKGSAARALADHVGRSGRCLLINASFSFDTDSVLNGLHRFLNRHLGGDDGQMSRSRYFRQAGLAGWTRREPLVIIVNGAERFFSLKGKPISAEWEELLQIASGRHDDEPGASRGGSGGPRVRWVFFATERVRSYMTQELGARPVEFGELFDCGPPHSDLPFRQLVAIKEALHGAGKPPGAAWNRVLQEASRFQAQSASRMSGDTDGLRRAFYDWALAPEILAKIHPDMDLALKCLRVLAFFGLPVERYVLRRALRQHGSVSPDLRPVIDALVKAGLVLELAGFGGEGEMAQKDDARRFVLHRSMLAELRFRFGIPISEAKLSTAFNMSLYVAQPVDGYIPEPEIHDELGGLIDGMLGTYRSGDRDRTEAAIGKAAREARATAGEYGGWLTEASDAAMSCATENAVEDRCRIHRLCGWKGVQALRAALAVIRGYYATTGILTLDRGNRLLREDRDGILLEHAERLDRVIDAYAKIALARESMRGSLATARPLKKDADLFERIYGSAEPLYADELVWLHNERGVVRLAMGDLYEARASFERAMEVNREFVEYADRTHNWRRIRVNQLTVEMENGRIDTARRMAEEIVAICPTQAVAGRGHPGPLDEDRRTSAIARGYIAWHAQLSGEYPKADGLFAAAITCLSDLGEARAQAYFLRLKANIRENDGSADVRRSEMQQALSLAEATRQMDLAHRIRISLANDDLCGRTTDVTKQKRANRMLENALEYSLQTDVHRVRCEASMSIARARAFTGDHEGALRYATDALMIANRYGLELRKVVLRADIARTMAARGHPVTAEHLALTAIRVASRQRFETAISRAQDVLLDIPRMSDEIARSDRSGRRAY